MEERSDAPERMEELYDIFLCTRELPDQLTGETAALRQLCSALVGDGYKVFFPSGLPRDLTDEQRAAKIVEALKGSKIMVAAGIGTEGLNDPVSRKLWSEFRKDPARPFFLCWREQGDAPFPEELAGVTPFDMSELTFLVKLKEQLTGLLPVREAPEEEPVPELPETEPEAPAEVLPETPEEVPVEEAPEEVPAEEAPEETPAEAAPVPARKPFPWKWVLLAAAAVILLLFLKRC